MQAYMRTSDPFFGIQKRERTLIARELRKQFPPADAVEWRASVLALWAQPHREEKYLAIDYARLWPRFHTPAAAPLFARLIVEGAWWDLVDPVAVNLVGTTYLAYRDAVRPTLDDWIDDDNLWLRRTALLSQIKHRDATDEAQLFDYCLRRSAEKEFFIRKAIGWALRDYSWTRPEAVRAFLAENRERLSPLSVREGAKRLAATGQWPATERES